MISDYAWDGNTTNWTASLWKKWTQAFHEKSLPYMFTLGNHDADVDISRIDIAKMDVNQTLSLTEMGPDNIGGVTNYYKAVYDQTGTKKLFYIWVLDSNVEHCEGVHGFGCVSYDQIQWFREQNAKLVKEDGKKLPGYVFIHIPIPEYVDLWNLNPTYGVKYEDVTCSSVNTGLYGVMKSMGNIRMVASGHDHLNDYWGDYNGIKLFYGRKTGPSGCCQREDLKKGARVFEFSINPATDDIDLKSWIREEDGNIDWQETATKVQDKEKPLQAYCIRISGAEIIAEEHKEL